MRIGEGRGMTPGDDLDKMVVKAHGGYIRYLRLLIGGKSQALAAHQAMVGKRTWQNAEAGKRVKIESLKGIRNALAQGLQSLVKPGEEPIAVTLEELIVPDKIEETAEFPRSIGLERCYFGEGDNDFRNREKQKALDVASGTVYLLAKTGQAYFFDPHAVHVEQFLTRDSANRFVAILLDPFSESAVKMYANWLRTPSATAEGTTEATALRLLHHHRNKLQNTLSALKGSPFNKVDLRFTPFDLSCTVLWTDGRYFIEPYFQFDELDRDSKKLNTFEFQLGPSSPLADAFRPDAGNGGLSSSLTHIDYYYQYSVDINKWIENINNGYNHSNDIISYFINIGLIDSDKAGWIKGYFDRLKDLVRR
jgi:hypothetical protein